MWRSKKGSPYVGKYFFEEIFVFKSITAKWSLLRDSQSYFRNILSIKKRKNLKKRVFIKKK